jgi:MFS transporter, AAHS family, 4-hydroxybenzoate transporter
VTPSSLPLPVAPARLSGLQLSSILICFLMNMLDGMDVLVISYTAASIQTAWGVAAPAFGIVFSAGLLGMVIGGMGLSPLADRVGRRTLILGCAGLMGVSVIGTSFAQSLPQLIGFRLVSGIGIGGMLASTATLTAEYAPAKTKDFWVSFVMAGYPIGAVLSGLATAQIIVQSGWQTVFLLAGVVTLLTLPLVWFFLGESFRPKTGQTEPSGRLEKNTAPSVRSLLGLPTYLLWTGLFMCFATLYFLTSWIPKLATTAGLPLELAIYAGTVYNLGAFFGIITQGYLSGRFGLRQTICGFLFGTAGLMAGFGLVTGSAWVLVIMGFIGFGIQGGFVGLYSVAARLYPTQIRATGVGWAMGLGRVGSIVGPLAGGLLIGANVSMVISFWAFAVPLVISGIATLFISSPDIP